MAATDSLHSVRAAEVEPEIIVTLPSSLRRNSTGRGSAAVPGPLEHLCTSSRHGLPGTHLPTSPPARRGAEQTRECLASAARYISIDLKCNSANGDCGHGVTSVRASHRVQARSDAQQLAIDARSYMRRFDR